MIFLALNLIGNIWYNVSSQHSLTRYIKKVKLQSEFLRLNITRDRPVLDFWGQCRNWEGKKCWYTKNIYICTLFLHWSLKCGIQTLEKDTYIMDARCFTGYQLTSIYKINMNILENFIIINFPKNHSCQHILDNIYTNTNISVPTSANYIV